MCTLKEIKQYIVVKVKFLSNVIVTITLIAASTLPLYAFKKDRDDSEEFVAMNSSKEQPQSPFLNLLFGQWDDRMRRGLFRYDVTNCKTKIITGKYGFIAQLNEGRHLKKRSTEFRIDQVLQPFVDSKFNFTKVGQEEVLFRFEKSNDCKSHFLPSTSPAATNAEPYPSPSVIAINVSNKNKKKNCFFQFCYSNYKIVN